MNSAPDTTKFKEEENTAGPGKAHPLGWAGPSDYQKAVFDNLNVLGEALEELKWMLKNITHKLDLLRPRKRKK